MFEFDLESDDWYVEEEFEAIKSFRSTGAYSVARLGDSNGIIGVTIIEDGEKPSEAQLAALHYFNEHQHAVMDGFCQGVIDAYPRFMEIYDCPAYDAELGFPELKSLDDVRKIIGIGGLFVRTQEKDGIAYMGFECGCPWDEEHGLGILMHKERVIDAEAADLAFSGGYYEMKKDNGTYSEEEELAAQRRVEEMRRPYLEQLAREEARRQNKKWWQFWKG